MNLTVAVYDVPNEVSNCFMNKLKRLGSLDGTGKHCNIEGMMIDKIRQLVGFNNSGSFRYIPASGYGYFYRGSWTGMLNSIQNGTANVTLPNLSPTITRVSGFHYIYPFLSEDYKQFIIHPIPKVTQMNIINAFNSSFWVLFLSSYIFLVIYLALVRSKSSFKKSVASLLFDVQFQARSRTLWHRQSEKVIIVIWSVMTARVLYTYLKSNLYKQMKTPIPLPDSIADLGRFPAPYHIATAESGAEFHKLHDLLPPTRLKPMRGVETMKYLTDIPGCILVEPKSIADRYRTIPKIVVKTLRRPIASKTTLFARRGTSPKIIKRLTRNAQIMWTHGLMPRIEALNYLPQPKEPRTFDPLDMPSIMTLLPMFWKLYVTCILALVFELLAECLSGLGN